MGPRHIAAKRQNAYPARTITTTDVVTNRNHGKYSFIILFYIKKSSKKKKKNHFNNRHLSTKLWCSIRLTDKRAADSRWTSLTVEQPDQCNFIRILPSHRDRTNGSSWRCPIIIKFLIYKHSPPLIRIRKILHIIDIIVKRVSETHVPWTSDGVEICMPIWLPI